MTCIGTYQNHRLYYDTKHGEYLLMTPNFRFCRMFGHCNNEEVAEWANKLKIAHKRDSYGSRNDSNKRNAKRRTKNG